MHRILLVVIVILLSLQLKAQNEAKDTINLMKVEIIKDNRIDNLNKTYSNSYHLDGYRVQIYSGNKKQPARQARMEFTKFYRKTKAYEMYEQPYFKVRVGDFKTKIEALKFKNNLVKHFPNCIIVKDEIEFEN